MMKTIISLL